MIARRQLPDAYRTWNQQWGAPGGHRLLSNLRSLGSYGHRASRALAKAIPSIAGPFSLQTNNSTRAYEYPWAFNAVPVRPGMRVLEIGGGLAGFQFVLSSMGCEVHNVDPGEQQWPVDANRIARLNRAFGTAVTLHPCLLADAHLDAESFDIAYSVSVLEHVPEAGAVEIVKRVHELLVPGGHFILTVDLFLDLEPFTAAVRNEWGTNVSVRRLVEAAPFTMTAGDPHELYGFDDFDMEGIRGRLDELLVGNYPALAQLLVLRKDA